jgi:hypothetical protein
LGFWIERRFVEHGSIRSPGVCVRLGPGPTEGCDVLKNCAERSSTTER